MKAIRFDGQALSLDPRQPVPAPGAGDALIRVRRAAIGPTETAIARGLLRPDSPLTIGHEFVGLVEQTSVPADAPSSLAERASLKGKRVVASPSIVCGHCDMCRSGLSPHCRSRRVLGLSGRDGSLAEYLTIPLANLLPVPDPVDDDAAAFVPSVALAAHAAQIARTAAKAYIGVLANDGDPSATTTPQAPADLLALLITKILSMHNASARLLTRSPALLGIAERWGIRHRPLAEVGRRQDQDVVVDCSGSSLGLRLAAQMVRPRGTIISASPTLVPGFPPGAPMAETVPAPWAKAVDLTPILSNEVTVIGCRDGQGGLAEAIHLVARGDLDVRSLIGKRIKLDDAVAGIRAASDAGAMKILVEI